MVKSSTTDLVFDESLTLLKWGLHPAASDALRHAGFPASRVGQTIGNAVASAGTHAQDGIDHGHPYCAATDFQVLDLNEETVKTLLSKLADVGYAAYYRHAGLDGWNGVTHIHGVYAFCKMKPSLQRQVHSWLHHPCLNGLVSNTPVTFWMPNSTQQNIVRAGFLKNNPVTVPS